MPGGRNRLRAMELGLEGRICLITGGSSGIGLQVARDLQEAGAQVAICARDRDRLEAARAGLGPGALAVIAGEALPGSPRRPAGPPA